MTDISTSIEAPEVILRTYMKSNGDLDWKIISPEPRRDSIHDEHNIDAKTNKDIFSKSRHKTYRHICLFGLFTIISITVGVIVVCLTAPKLSDRKCIPTFKRSANVTIQYDARPKYVATGDFNGDDQRDIVIVNLGTNSIGILLIDENGTLTKPDTYSTGDYSTPYWAGVGYFNNDTALDIAVANYGTNNIGIFLGNGDGNFADQTTFTLNSSRPVALAIEDFNNDTYFDIAVISNGTFYLTLLLGDGNGSFSFDSEYYMGYDSKPYALAVTDFNNDSRADIVIVNYGTGDIAILLGTDNGTFIINRYSTGKGSHPCSVTVGDFDKDFYIDIAFVRCGTNSIGILIGNGNGTFKDVHTYLTDNPSDLQFIVTARVDDDANLDLVIADTGGDNIIVFKGDGNGNFLMQANQTTGYRSRPSSITIADFDNDFHSDVIVTNTGNNYALVFMSYGYHTTATQTIYSTGDGSSPNSVATGDFDKDGLLDIVVPNTYTNNIGIFMGSGNGTFKSQMTLSMVWDGAGPYRVSVGDFNNDTQLDIAVAENWIGAIDIFLGQGTGSFTYQYTMWLDSSYYPNSLTQGDFNNDTYLDLVTSSCETDSLMVFLGHGDGTLESGTTYRTNSSSCPAYVAVGDFNNDRILDLASANSAGQTVNIFIGIGNGSFQNPITTLVTSYYPTWLAVGYLDNDQYQDIVIASPEDSKIGILLGNGNGTFQDINPYYTGFYAYPRSVVLGDFSKDNKTDIAVANSYDNNIVIFFGDGTGYFTPQDPISLDNINYPSTMATGDFNNDKQIDLVIANSGTYDISVLLLTYEASFRNQTPYYQGSGSHPFFLTSVDFNKNHQMDIIVANSANDTVQILIDYQKNGTFMSNITYPTGLITHPRYVATYDFNRDNQLDIAVITSFTDYLMIYLLADNGTVLQTYVYYTGYYAFPNSLALGDFNQDGWIDVVVANNNTNNVGVFLGYSYPNFVTYELPGLERGSVPFYAIAADFNKDSICDVAVAYRAQDAIGIYFGDENNTLLNQTTYYIDASSKPVSLAIGDFNNDTILDIAIANEGEYLITIILRTDNADDAYGYYPSYATELGSPVSIAVSDFNNDTIQDIVIVSLNGNFTGIFMGYGNGSFSDQILYLMPVGSSPCWVIVSDFNNDHITDIATANYGLNNIGIYLGYGDGNFSNLTMYSTGNNSGPSSIDVGDFNKDNCMDIAVANQNAKNIGIMLGDCTGQFSLQTTYSTGVLSVLTSIIVRDLNNDTLLDIAVTDWGTGNGYIGILYGTKDGSFLLSKRNPTGFNSDPTSIAVGDFDNDGQLDLAITNSGQSRIRIMLQDESEPFGEQITYSTGNASRPYSVAVADLDNDGRLDIASANSQADTISLFYGYGNGSFQDQITCLTGNDSHPMFIATGFINNDKYVDIVVSNGKADNILIFYGDGSRTFRNMDKHSTGPNSGPTSVALADLDKDNHTDIVVTNAGINTVLVFYGYGNGTFKKPESFEFDYGDTPISAAIGYYNNDSLLDIAVANYGQSYVEVLLRTC